MVMAGLWILSFIRLIEFLCPDSVCVFVPFCLFLSSSCLSRCSSVLPLFCAENVLVSFVNDAREVYIHTSEHNCVCELQM